MSVKYARWVLANLGDHEGPCKRIGNACKLHRQTALAVLVAEGVDVRDIWPALGRMEPDDRRWYEGVLAELAEAHTKPGPPARTGLTIETIRARLREWEYGWPPSQSEVTGYSARRVRQVLKDAGPTWDVEMEAAERER